MPRATWLSLFTKIVEATCAKARSCRAVIVCAAGDIHGAIDRLYDEVLAFEESLGVRFTAF